MTGIERLREFVAGISPITVVCGVTKTAYDREHMESVGVRLRDFLADIADQIERETIPREPGDGDVGPETLHAMALAQLDDWERDAIAWVREHGGIATVKEEWNHSRNLKRQFETAQAKVERQQRHIEFVQRKCRERQEHICELNKLKRAYVDALNGVCKRLGLTDGTGLPDMPEIIWTELDRRLMPEGMEWPRFEDGEPVLAGNVLLDANGETFRAVSFLFTCDWWSIEGYQGPDFCTISKDTRRELSGMPYSRRVKRPAPKVLDADGVEIRVGDEVWTDYGDGPWTVTKITTAHAWHVYGESDELGSLDMPPSTLTHRAPVLAADGRPLREGETVWGTKGGSYHLTSVHDGKVFARHVGGSFGAEVESAGGEGLYRLRADQLTHERPVADSWERLEEDAESLRQTIAAQLGDYDFDESGKDSVQTRLMALVRRARALAGDV